MTSEDGEMSSCPLLGKNSRETNKKALENLNRKQEAQVLFLTLLLMNCVALFKSLRVSIASGVRPGDLQGLQSAEILVLPFHKSIWLLGLVSGLLFHTQKLFSLTLPFPPASQYCSTNRWAAPGAGKSCPQSPGRQ